MNRCGVNTMVRTLVISLCFTLFLVTHSHADSKQLDIRPIAQQTPVWCWAAVSEMVLKHYRFPNLNRAGNYQCGVVGSLGANCGANCGACVTSIGTTFQMSRVISNYQNLSDHVRRGHRGRHFDVSPAARLSPSEIVDEIDEGDPVIAGISPSGMGAYYPQGMSEHAVLMVGYRNSRRGFQVLVNDPMPYGLMGHNPYLTVGAKRARPGQYWIDYRIFVRRFVYKDSIYFDTSVRLKIE